MENEISEVIDRSNLKTEILESRCSPKSYDVNQIIINNLLRKMENRALDYVCKEMQNLYYDINDSRRKEITIREDEIRAELIDTIKIYLPNINLNIDDKVKKKYYNMIFPKSYDNADIYPAYKLALTVLFLMLIYPNYYKKYDQKKI